MYNYFCKVVIYIMSCLTAMGINVYPVKGDNIVACTKENICIESCESTEFTFESQKVNTVSMVLSESKNALIEIFIGDELIYTRAGTEINRFCAFKTVETDKLTVKITGEGVTVSKAEVLYKCAKTDDFRVTAYVVGSSVLKPEDLSYNSFDVITDVILFSCVTFDETGTLSVDRSVLERSLKNLRDVIGERDVNIYINILGPDSQGEFSTWEEKMRDKQERHSSAFKKCGFATEIAKLADEYDFDGIFFDYEYPLEKEYWFDFNCFLEKLDLVTRKKIGLAVATWNLGISPCAMNSVDLFEVMQYDLFNEYGHHADFDTVVTGLDQTRKYLMCDKKIDLGMPFYARPSDRGEFWYDYKAYANVLGKGNDATIVDGKTSYFNCWQTVYDKTAYALSQGVGGVMVWHYSCDIVDTDNALSLFGAMGECIKDRTK